MTWTDARIAQLARLWGAGVSASGIAEALGDVSRSAVLGKLHRLKLLRSRQPASAPRRYDGPTSAAGDVALRRLGAQREHGGRAAPPSPPKSPWRESAFEPLAGTAPRLWLTREFGECAFPVGGDGEEILSCCAPVKPHSAYCATHHKLVFKPVPPSAQAADLRRWAEAVERRAIPDQVAA
jgi:GcrA cell cycle regulator